MTNDITPKAQIILTDQNKLKAYIHPTRIQILELLAKEKQTISRIARQLSVHPANLTHHFKLLERTGLIKLVEKRDIGKTVEKYYRAIAYAFETDFTSQNKINKKALALTVLKNDLVSAIRKVKEKNNDKVLCLLKTARISAQDLDTFFEDLKQLSAKFEKKDSVPGTAYNLNMSLYPAETEIISSQKITIHEKGIPDEKADTVS